MPADTVLVIDAGTSGIRAVAVGPDGATARIAGEPLRLFAAPGASPFARELDAAEVTASLERLLEAAAPIRERIAGIAFTGQREGLAFCDEQGEAILLSPNIDARASAEGMAIDAQCGQRVYAVTGHLPSLLLAPAKLQWLRANRAQDAARVATAMPLADWLAMRLTGKRVCSRTLAAENGFLDIATGDIACDLLEDLAFPASLVLPVVADGAVAGLATQGALAGLPVALAGADTQCALAGMGALAPGDAGIAAGWSAPVQIVAPAPVMDAGSRIWTGLHVTPGRWVLESNAGDTGSAWAWACKLVGVTLPRGDEIAAEAPPGSHDTLAVLGPRRMHAAKMTAGTGALAVPLPFAMSAPDRGDALRAVLEGIAFALRANLEQLDSIAGASGAIMLGGGMSASAVFARVVCDVLGRPVGIARSPETSALGATVVASPALGLHDTLESAAAAMTAGGERLEPSMRTSAQYDDVYERWCALADRLGSGV